MRTKPLIPGHQRRPALGEQLEEPQASCSTVTFWYGFVVAVVLLLFAKVALASACHHLLELLTSPTLAAWYTNDMQQTEIKSTNYLISHPVTTINKNQDKLSKLKGGKPPPAGQVQQQAHWSSRQDGQAAQMVLFPLSQLMARPVVLSCPWTAMRLCVRTFNHLTNFTQVMCISVRKSNPTFWFREKRIRSLWLHSSWMSARWSIWLHDYSSSLLCIVITLVVSGEKKS